MRILSCDSREIRSKQLHLSPTSKRQILLLVVLYASLSYNSMSASAGWIDIHTPKDKLTTKSMVDGLEYKLVMSDEFNVPNRSFEDGSDPTWTSLDKPDADSNSAGGGSLQFYNSSQVTTTEEGYLKITPKSETKEWMHYDSFKKKYRKITTSFKSGMLQSWNKFCFTGGIVEVDIKLPGNPSIGGLWPAVWLLGNLGRATYEASTNNIWPWSYNVCDRNLQEAQVISACNTQNHFGLHPGQGRGATEIDIIEVMAGTGTYLPNTFPPIKFPYADVTLQVAPGINKYRPVPGFQPRPKIILESGDVGFVGQNWYSNLGTQGNTSINPYFYGTYLGLTNPEEPVQRGKHQTFQADAISAMHQLLPDHFETMHTIRLEWQPGPGGSLDWFIEDRQNRTESIEGENGKRWIRAFSIKDDSLREAMGSQIPIEPSYLILNVAISSAWGFPYRIPEWCSKCYDCTDSKCHCSFHHGFCDMMKDGKVDMLVDHIRVYQNPNDAHHTVGCDLKDYPSREYIKGHEGRYSRSDPFVFEDRGPIRPIKKGGAKCTTDSDCGGITVSKSETLDELEHSEAIDIRGVCVEKEKFGLFSATVYDHVCLCNDGFTGPHCLSLDHKDDEPGVYELMSQRSLFDDVPVFRFPKSIGALLMLFGFGLLVCTLAHVRHTRKLLPATTTMEKPFDPSTLSFDSTR